MLPAVEALEVASGARARLLAGGGGSLIPGAPADSTVVAGRVLMRGGEVEGPRRSSPAPPSERGDWV